MRIRSLAPLAVAVALGASLIAVPTPASAETVTVKPETFAGGAASRALDLSVLGQKLTLGDTVANIVKGVNDAGATTLLAKAVGTGQLSLLGNTTATSSVTANGSQTSPKACAGIELPAQLSAILNIGLACGASTAKITDGLLSSAATGEVGDISLKVNNLLAPLGLQDLTETLPIGGLLDTLLGVTKQLNIPVAGTPLENLNVNDLLSTLLESVLNTETLSVTIGDAVSETLNTANTVTAKAHSAAVDIKILPKPILGTKLLDKPLLQILIAEANASATYDRLTGKPVGDPTFDPAIVRLRGVLVDALGLGLVGGKGTKDADGIALALGQDLVLLAGTPLESRIALGAGKIVDDGVFGKKAVADGVAIELLKGISGGIALNLAHAEAGAIDTLATTKVLSLPSIDIARDIPTSLPRTGAEDALPLALAGTAIAIVAVRRARMAAAAK